MKFRDPESKISLHLKKHNVLNSEDDHCYAHPEFYAYYADYDWVLLCSLFGSMMQLPPGFPMYCKDLKQYMDQLAHKLVYSNNKTHTKETALAELKQLTGYPSNDNNHNALSDAKWNYKLYNFLKQTFNEEI